VSDYPVLTWQFSQVDCETEKISSFTIHGGSAIQLDSQYEDKQHAKYWNKKILVSEKRFACFLVSLTLLLPCHAVSCQAGANWEVQNTPPDELL